MKTTLLSFIAICCGALLFGQNNVSLHFNHLLNEVPFALDQSAPVMGDYEVKIDRLEYYVSEIQITHDGGVITNIEDVYLLVRPHEQSVFELGSWDINTVEAVQFGFGVDASVNTADPGQWSSDHPLSYQNPSMHWGWAAGYRFLAIEGRAGDGFIYEYEIHALGNDNYGMVNLTFDGTTAADGNLAIGIDADYSKIFNNVDVEFGDIVHSTNLPKAITSLDNCKELVFSPGTVVSGIVDLDVENMLLVSPNPIANNTLAMTIGNWSQEQLTLQVFDAIGKLVQSELINTSNVSVDVVDLVEGLYFVQLSDAKGNKSTKRFVK